MYFNIDSKFVDYFHNLKQVFLYIINECNLDCPQCIYKPNNYFNIGQKEIKIETAKKLISDFYALGARKLSLLGGEPTLYGKYQEHHDLIAELIAFGKEIGYEYVRIDTNGTFHSTLLENENFAKLDELSFSMDGYDRASCDKIRGVGVYDKAIANIKKAITLGYKVDITCCVYHELLKRDKDGTYLIEKLIELASKLGVKRVNFHGLIKDGTPIDLWSSELQVAPDEWVRVYNDINSNILAGKYPIDVRIPRLFVTKEEFRKNPEYYGFCPVKLGERVLIHPDGIIRICSGLLGTAYGVGNYNDYDIKWNDGFTNEIAEHNLNLCTWCTNRSKKDYGKYVPLCFSFKPNQNEFVYERLLKWENRKLD